MTELSDHARRRIDALVAASYEPREALLQAMEIAQAEQGHISDDVAAYLGNRLKLNRAEIEDVLTFYTVFSHEVRGRHVIRVCHTLPCALVGGEAVIDYLSHRLGIAEGETTSDGRFTLLGVECLGRCEEAPVMMIDDAAYGYLTPGRIDAILASLDDDDAAAAPAADESEKE